MGGKEWTHRLRTSLHPGSVTVSAPEESLFGINLLLGFSAGKPQMFNKNHCKEHARQHPAKCVRALRAGVRALQK